MTKEEWRELMKDDLPLKFRQKKLEIIEFQRYTRTTAAKASFRTKDEILIAWALGLIGEAGDLVGCVKKTLFHENLQIAGIRDNIGDCLWYLSEIANFFNWDLRDILAENKTKLDKRIAENKKKGRSHLGAARKGERIDWMEKKKKMWKCPECQEWIPVGVVLVSEHYRYQHPDVKKVEVEKIETR